MKTEPLFLNRIVNSNGDLLSIESSADDGSREETRITGAAKDHASRTPERTGA